MSYKPIFAQCSLYVPGDLGKVVSLGDWPVCARYIHSSCNAPPRDGLRGRYYNVHTQDEITLTYAR